MIRFDFAFAYISDCIELGRQIKSHLKLLAWEKHGVV